MKHETRVHSVNKGYSEVTLNTRHGSIELEAGTGDHISVHRYDREHMLVLSINYGLPYVGCELIELKTMERVGSAFFQEEAVECVEPGLLDLTECTIADYMADYLI